MGWAAEEHKMSLTYFPFSSYIVGILYLIPHFILNFKKYRTINYTFTSQTLINGTVGLAKRFGIFNKAKVILRESNSIFDLLKGKKLKVYTFFYFLGYKNSSVVICQTNYMREQLIKAIPRLASKLNIQVISNPFNFDDVLKNSHNILPQLKDKKFLVAAGRLAPAKGFDILIDAFYFMEERYKDLYLVILGEGKDREPLQTKINGLGIESKVLMPGYVQNVYSYFKNAEVCVLSSRIEGFPNVLLQMMSQNTKVVATLCAGGIEEIPGLFTCPAENVQGLRESIEMALNSPSKNLAPKFKEILEKRSLASFYETIITLSN